MTGLTTKRFWADRRGATSIEYSLIIGVLFLAIVAGVRSFANSNTAMYEEISSAVLKR